MRTLTENQKNFLLEHFFKEPQYPGWNYIATKLLATGSCIVAGDTCLWIGGIGNFIKTSNILNAVDCLLYEFDLDQFLSSEWYREIHKEYLIDSLNKLKQLELEYKDIYDLYNDID